MNKEPEIEAPVKPKIIYNAVRCTSCRTVAESLSIKDRNSCNCGGIIVLGGLEYLQRAGNLMDYDELSLYEGQEDKLAQIRAAAQEFRRMANFIQEGQPPGNIIWDEPQGMWIAR